MPGGFDRRAGAKTGLSWDVLEAATLVGGLEPGVGLGFAWGDSQATALVGRVGVEVGTGWGFYWDTLGAASLGWSQSPVWAGLFLGCTEGWHLGRGDAAEPEPGMGWGACWGSLGRLVRATDTFSLLPLS